MPRHPRETARSWQDAPPRIRRADLDPATNVPYDSVMEMGDGSHQEFIVYDGAQVYPE